MIGESKSLSAASLPTAHLSSKTPFRLPAFQKIKILGQYKFHYSGYDFMPVAVVGSSSQIPV